MPQVTRRAFLTAWGAATLLPREPPRALGAPGFHPAPRLSYRFFDAAEARFIEAACERLIPADASGSGATAAGVAAYLDRQLAGAWGRGTLLYRESTWQPGSPTLPGRIARAPAVVFRHALSAIIRHLDRRGAEFSRLPMTAQDALLASLENGSVDLPGVPVAAFFAALLTLTVEGFFSDPRHGARRDRIAWRVGGFPGAHAITYNHTDYQRGPVRA
jgi:gluconate 2-dehydrogenase gamma chain